MFLSIPWLDGYHYFPIPYATISLFTANTNELYLIYNSPKGGGLKGSMVSLANYNNLTIRISRMRIFRRNKDNNNYLFVAKSDEIPGCAAHGLTISEALNNFQKTAELWLKWFDNSPN